MKVYQLYYTREGRQELGAGWKVLAKSDGVTAEMLNYYGGMRSNEVQLVGNARSAGKSFPGRAFELERSGYYLYLTQSNYQAAGGDIRGNHFYHGLIFYMGDFFTLCQDPALICGLGSGTFVHSAELSAGSSLPVLEKLTPNQSFDFRSIVRRYGLDAQSYARLMRAMYWKAFHPEENFCIRVNVPEEQMEQCCRELMYVIYCGLPWQFRVRLTFSSCLNYQGKIFFSTVQEGNNGFDLETGECTLPQDTLAEFPYIQQLVQNAWDSSRKNAAYARIAEICQDIWGNGLDPIGHEQMQVVCDAVFREMGARQLSACLDQALRLRENPSEELDDYIVWLIERMRGQGQRFSGEQMDWILERINSCDSQRLREEYPYLFVQVYCETPSQESFASLYQMRKSNPDWYRAAVARLAEEPGTFIEEYFRDYICAEVISGLGQMAVCTGEYPEICKDQRFVSAWADKIRALYEVELPAASGGTIPHVPSEAAGEADPEEDAEISGNEARHELWLAYTKYLGGCLKDNPALYQTLCTGMTQQLWDAFSFEEFQCGLIAVYRTWGLEYAARNYESAKKVAELCAAEQKLLDAFAVDPFIRLFVENESYSAAERENLLSDFRTEYENRNDITDPALLLWLYYSPEHGRFMSADWLKRWQRYGQGQLLAEGCEQSWRAFAGHEQFCSLFLEDIKGLVAQCKKLKKRELAAEVAELGRLLEEGPAQAQTGMDGVEFPGQKRDPRSLEPLLQKLLLVAAGFLVEAVFTKLLCRTDAVFGYGALVGCLVVSILLGVLAVVFFRTQDGDRLADFDADTVRDFYLTAVCLLAVCLVAMAVVWLVDAWILPLVVLVGAVVLLGTGFVFALRD